MRFKRKIPSFIFGLSIGLVIGLGFFAFKFNELFNKLKDSAKGQVTVIQQPVKTGESDNKVRKNNKDKYKIKIRKSENNLYRVADSLVSSDPDLKIAREELQGEISVKIIKLGQSSSPADTLAAQLAGVEHNRPEQIDIEFWRTPLNSKGYRFTRNKLMLYGLVDFNNVQVFQLDNGFYVKASGILYKVVYSSDFRPLERVLDPDLLSQINS